MSSVMSSESAHALSGQDTLVFTLFPALPPELRLMIWKFALPGPRVIALLTREETTTSNPNRNTSWKFYDDFKSPASSNPVLLHVNQESRALVLSNYQLTFDKLLCRPIYLDFAIDALFFPTVSQLRNFILAGHKGSDMESWGKTWRQIQAVRSIVLGLGAVGICEYDLARTCIWLHGALTGLHNLILTASPQPNQSGDVVPLESSEPYLKGYQACLAEHKRQSPVGTVSRAHISTMEVDEVLRSCEGKVRMIEEAAPVHEGSTNAGLW
ncbi:uncharacterized protein RSE6_11563 [Rhynchosporium secalis]|uniref:2EXR domain-containing protein n=1 Tax=Rhynchosporium secalis TaxID=38038 RepID=A0A1E1MP81_RHYSE|nr:uncharacterized protein RSE6_11563 [Rhynchosporium secalis]